MTFEKVNLDRLDISLLFLESTLRKQLDNLSTTKRELIEERYPTFLASYYQLLQDTRIILDRCEWYQILARENSVDLVRDLLYQANDQTFQAMTDFDFATALVRKIALQSISDDEDLVNETNAITKEIMGGESINWSRLFQRIDALDVSDSLKYFYIRCFQNIHETNETVENLLQELSVPYYLFKRDVDTLFADSNMNYDLSIIENWINLENKSLTERKNMFVDVSYVMFWGINAKIPLVDDECSFVLFGRLFDFFHDDMDQNEPDVDTMRYHLIALGDEKRIKMFEYMIGGERYLKEFATMLSLSSSTVSHHMSFFTSSGLVTMKERGKRIYYSLNTEALKDIAHFFKQLEEQERRKYEKTSAGE